MENTDNINPTSENTLTELFKLSFSGASGNNTKPPKTLVYQGFSLFLTAS